MATKPNYADKIRPSNGSIVFKDILVNSRRSVKILNILRSIPESRDHAKFLFGAKRASARTQPQESRL